MHQVYSYFEVLVTYFVVTSSRIGMCSILEVTCVTFMTCIRLGLLCLLLF